MAIRLAILMNRFPTTSGGTENLIAALCPLLAERGVDITIVSRRNPAYPASIPGATIVQSPVVESKAGEWARYVTTAVNTLRGVRPDVIHAQSLLSPTTAAVLAGRWLGVPVVATVHGGGRGGEIDRLQHLRRGGPLRLRLIRDRVDRFVVISDEIDSELASIGVERARRRAIPNGVDTERFSPAEPSERAHLRGSLGLGDAPTAVYVGRIVRGKGVGTMLDAFERVRSAVPDARLLIVGDGSLRASLEARAGDGVEFLGALDDVTGPLRAADVFVLASRAEGLPLSILEAMACGLAVVSTDVGAIREVVGQAGRIVSPEAPDELSAELTRLLTDAGLRDRLGADARSRVVVGFDLARTADALVALYEELAALQRVP